MSKQEECEHEWNPLIGPEYVCGKCRLRLTFFDLMCHGRGSVTHNLPVKGLPKWMSKESSKT